MYSFHIFFGRFFVFVKWRDMKNRYTLLGLALIETKSMLSLSQSESRVKKNRYTHFFFIFVCIPFQKKKMGTNEAKSQYAFEKKGIWKEKARRSIGTRKKQKETNSTQCHVYDIPISSLYPLNPHTFHVHRSKLLRASTQIKRLTFDVDCTFRESIFFSLRSRISNGIQCKG